MKNESAFESRGDRPKALAGLARQGHHTRSMPRLALTLEEEWHSESCKAAVVTAAEEGCHRDGHG